MVVAQKLEKDAEQKKGGGQSKSARRRRRRRRKRRRYICFFGHLYREVLDVWLLMSLMHASEKKAEAPQKAEEVKAHKEKKKCEREAHQVELSAAQKRAFGHFERHLKKSVHYCCRPCFVLFRLH